MTSLRFEFKDGRVGHYESSWHPYPQQTWFDCRYIRAFGETLLDEKQAKKDAREFCKSRGVKFIKDSFRIEKRGWLDEEIYTFEVEMTSKTPSYSRW